MLYPQGESTSLTKLAGGQVDFEAKHRYFGEKKNLFRKPGVEPQILRSQAHSPVRTYENTNNTYTCQCNIEDHMDCNLHMLI